MSNDRLTTTKKEDSRREKKRAAREQKAQALRAVLNGQGEGESGEELLSLLVRLSTERILQEALEEEQAVALGRGRYEARGEKGGSRNGDTGGTLRTGEGVLHVKVPQIRGQAEPYRAHLGNNVSTTSDVLTQLIVERYVGGMAQRNIEQGLERAGGHLLGSKSTVSDIAESSAEEYEAFRTRDLRHEPVADLFIDTVYEPFRRWGQKTGVLWVWAICEDGRKVLLSLSTANRESFESGREV